MPTPEELKAAEEQKKAEIEAAEKLKKEQEESEAARVKAEAEKVLAEDKRKQEVAEESKLLAEKLLQDALAKQKHEQDVERATWKLKAIQELGGGDETKLKESAELAKRGLKTFDPDDKLWEVISQRGLENHPAVLKMFMELGKAVANDSFKLPGQQPPPPRKPMTPRERLARGGDA